MEIDLTVTRSFRARMAIPDHTGMCQEPHGYRFFVTVGVSGVVAGQAPWVVDVIDIEQLLQSEVCDVLNNTDLSATIDYPSLEGTLEWICGRLVPAIPAISSVRLEAPPRYSVSWESNKDAN